MGCCRDRPYLCPVLCLGLIAVALQGVAFVAPGWIMLGRDVTIIQLRTVLKEVDTEIDTVGPVPSATGGPVPVAMTGTPVATTKEPVLIEEKEEFETWIKKSIIEFHHAKLRVNYGLWFSTVCMQQRPIGRIEETEIRLEEKEEAKPVAMAKRDTDSSSSDDDDDKRGGKHRRCHCKRISTYCALQYRTLFQDRREPHWYLSYKHFGYGSLCEHRIENCVALVLLVIGLVSAVPAFRRNPRCRYGAVTTVITFLLAAILMIVPVIRLSRFSMHKHEQEVPVYVHPPVSVVCSGVAAILAVIVTMVATVGGVSVARKERPGRFYQFNNELEFPAEGEKKPSQLVFVTGEMAEPLPEKTPLE